MELFNGSPSREGSAAVETLDKKDILVITPLSPDYRTLPITEGFDWPKIIQDIASERELNNEKLYLVVFRSIRKPGVADATVAELDRAAHEEAEESDALLHYFAGGLDEERRAMSWCLWTEQTAARQALSGPAHQEAVRQARALYDTFKVELYDVHLFGQEVIFDPVRRDAKHT